MGLPEDGDKGEDGALPDRAVTYQLWLHLAANIELTVGALGRCAFPAGWYVYTGSAKRGLRARLRRHSHPDGAKTVHWHADYLLASPQATVHYLILSAAPECAVNAAVGGCIPCPGFGASDCRSGCDSHLRYLGTDFDLKPLAPAP